MEDEMSSNDDGKIVSLAAAKKRKAEEKRVKDIVNRSREFKEPPMTPNHISCTGMGVDDFNVVCAHHEMPPPRIDVRFRKGKHVFGILSFSLAQWPHIKSEIENAIRTSNKGGPDNLG